MFATYTVHANCQGEVHTLTVTATSGAEAVADVRLRYALSGRIATVYLGF